MKLDKDELKLIEDQRKKKSVNIIIYIIFSISGIVFAIFSNTSNIVLKNMTLILSSVLLGIGIEKSITNKIRKLLIKLSN